MLDPKVLDRMQKLLYLATDNSNEHEAMQAALRLARLIREHDVLGLRAKEAPRNRRPEQSPVSPPTSPDMAARTYVEYMRKQQKQQHKNMRDFIDEILRSGM